MSVELLRRAGNHNGRSGRPRRPPGHPPPATRTGQPMKASLVRSGVTLLRIHGHGRLREGPRSGPVCAGGREVRRVRVKHAGCSDAPEETMKSLKWAATLGIVAVCVILFLNRDDVMRYQKMRQMS